MPLTLSLLPKINGACSGSQRLFAVSKRNPRIETALSMCLRESENNTSRKKTLQEARKKGRMDRSKAEDEMSSELQNLDVQGETQAAGTGLVYVDAFSQFHCLWDAR
ncbi:hypothetical protein DNTS_024632 [Danionella cerebrum]|uniref:Uncharacterized protein n=1 Tax=Danionella cerebrum TaxID=2873325 RepID=A0A553NHN7_9TELE|nr:hypothetical protein DNTS_024632 [Danionella translucida]